MPKICRCKFVFLTVELFVEIRRSDGGFALSDAHWMQGAHILQLMSLYSYHCGIAAEALVS